ncbi:hypothetical protein EST38_g10447 [Candolleomyces aberdarensis]|uniref:Uncharacterized protein n=1 Tax=Candolleomyces aberdarensis TaxID=2316362 RepID=A0A4Q2DA91_9AGAR|nr:hypothetical protein EST38_g10447 [Candolleomyces aberdarensis]
MAAAQFVCWGDKKLGTDTKLPPRVRIAHVLRFEWNPPADIRYRVTTLEEQDIDNEPNANEKPCFSPMKAKKDAELTPNFWQYAIVRQDILDKHLVYTKDRIKIHCDHVPKKDGLTVDMYIKTQDGNPDFATLMNGKERQPAAAVSSSSSGETNAAPNSLGKSSPPRSPKTPGKIIPPSSKAPGKISPPPSPKSPGKISPPGSPKPPGKISPPGSPKSPGKTSPPGSPKLPLARAKGLGSPQNVSARKK